MRVISGTHKGRIFKSPKGFATHPMGDKVRTALFDTLGDISGLSILDAFSGSGALAIEAISRGANEATAIEEDIGAYKIIKENIEALGMSSSIELLHVNARTWSNNNQHKLYDVVLLDPPYNHIQENLVEKLMKQTKVGGVGALSLPEHADIRFPEDTYQILANKSFANARLVFYRKIA